MRHLRFDQWLFLGPEPDFGHFPIFPDMIYTMQGDVQGVICPDCPETMARYIVPVFPPVGMIAEILR